MAANVFTLHGLNHVFLYLLVRVPPAMGSLSPESGTVLAQIFAAVYWNPNGAGDLTSVGILFNPSITGVNGYYAL